MELTDIKENPNNPRIIKDDKFRKLCDSIKDFPKMMALRPMVIDAKGMVLGGNMRLKALKELNFKDIPDTWVKKAEDLSSDEIKRFIVVDNIGFGAWNWDELANSWDTEELTNWGLDIPDFAVKEAVEDDYEIPDEIETDIVLGDLFEIGQHRLLCGDSTNADDVGRLMIQKADMMFADPPYNVDYEGKTKEKLKIQNDKIKDFSGFLTDAFLAADTYLKDGAVYYIAHPDIFAYEFIGAVRACNWKQARPAVVQWVKDSIVMGRGDYHSQSEPMLYGWKEGSAHFKVLTRDQSNVWHIERPKASKEHPTMKPVGLVGKAISNHSVGLIFDPFLGSGTTMVAAHQLNRKCYGMEIDPKYCEVIVQRMLKFDPSIEIKKNGKPHFINELITT